MAHWLMVKYIKRTFISSFYDFDAGSFSMIIYRNDPKKLTSGFPDLTFKSALQGPQKWSLLKTSIYVLYGIC